MIRCCIRASALRVTSDQCADSAGTQNRARGNDCEMKLQEWWLGERVHAVEDG
jgi:hypothetical protein